MFDGSEGLQVKWEFFFFFFFGEWERGESWEFFLFLRIRERWELRMESEWNRGKKKETKVKEGNII